MPLRLDADLASHSKLIINNIRIQLPPVALISVLPMTTIICEAFSLVGRPLSKTSNGITLIFNDTMHRTDMDVFNITMKLHENWNVKQFNTKSINDILSFIEKTPSAPPNTSFYFSFISSIWKIITTQAEEYGARTAVLEPYFAVIQAGDLQPYFNRNTDRKRLIYSVNTVKIRL